jgi:hypothetical protein
MLAELGVGLPGLDAALLAGGLLLGGSYAARFRVRKQAPPVEVGRMLSPMERVWLDLVGGESGGCLPGSWLVDVGPVPHGQAATIQLVGGKQHTGSAVGSRNMIASAYAYSLGITEDRIEVEPPLSGRPDQARLLVLEENPLHADQWWPGPSLSLASEGIASCGHHGDSEPARMQWFRHGGGAVNWILAGIPGSGKSTLVTWMLGESVHATFKDATGTVRPLVSTIFVDGKSGTSIPEANNSPGIAWSAIWLEECARAILAFQDDLYARQRYLSQLRWVDAQRRDREGMSYFDPIVSGLSYLQLVLEEWPALVLAYPWLVPIVHNIGKLGRSLGMRVVLIAQSIVGDELGSPELRNIMGGNAAACRTNDNHTGGLAFAGSMEVNPSSLPVDMPGAMFVKGPAQRAAMLRGFQVRDPYGVLSSAPAWWLHPVDVAGMGEHLALASARRDFYRAHGQDPERLPELWAPILAGHRGVSTAEVLAQFGHTPAVDAAPAAGGPADPRETEPPLQALVLAAVGWDVDVPLAQIREHVADISDRGWSAKSVANQVAALVDAGTVVKVGHGKYRRESVQEAAA